MAGLVFFERDTTSTPTFYTNLRKATELEVSSDPSSTILVDARTTAPSSSNTINNYQYNQGSQSDETAPVSIVSSGSIELSGSNSIVIQTETGTHSRVVVQSTVTESVSATGSGSSTGSSSTGSSSTSDSSAGRMVPRWYVDDNVNSKQKYMIYGLIGLTCLVVGL